MKIKFITAYDSRGFLITILLIHQRFDIVGILRDAIRQSIHNYPGYLEKKGRLGIQCTKKFFTKVI